MSSPLPPAEQGNWPIDAADREAFYDREIAPALLDIGRRCHAAGLSMMAAVEWDWGEVGSTFFYQEKHGPQLAHSYAAVCGGLNADTIIVALMDYARRNGHGSIFLKQLGVPLAPSEAPTC